ncbi:DNA-binding Xre family transcriptional regulator [Undibacterium sp. GrIS 1.8]|uniref:helix-turn-helix domain-containing protein n=1 Tax=Undibacterium sp. GrIS 1.8 TaxID=3143934 RepID=UPI00339B0F79
MDFIKQVNSQRHRLRKSVVDVSRIIGIEVSNLYRMFKNEPDVRSSTLDDLASALDAKWVLVPKHLLPEVERLISGKPIGVDDAPSSIDRLFGVNSS